ncbi:MAG: hypothetical protein LCH96_06955 [Actinobacteria bacterium]|nr:hypothetical protein [Actinomycetota bacterium]
MSSAPLAPDELEAQLTGWVDAAASGGFPNPSRSDRWRVLRAGVVNLWEFEVTEYWFANGWAQLTGRNETGKSSLMALTTLIPWLADTSSANIDTLGRSGKRFRYYVEPTNADGDRRSSDASTHRGWLWVEYGRLTDAGPRYFTTLLFAEARSAAADVKPIWCTVEGSARVRESIDLAPNRVVATPRDLQIPGLIVHPTATAYRDHVAGRLLASPPERLEAIGKMLRVTRTPKLGAQLEIAFVQKHLRSALPELSRGEVDALADGWDQLDQIRADLASTKAAAETIRRFQDAAWLPWARAVLRQRADAAGMARTEFDNVTRREVEARAEVVASQELQEHKLGDATTARQQAEGARRAADELQSSVRYQNAQGRVARLEGFRKQRAELERQLADTVADLTSAAGREDDARREVDERQADHDNWAVGSDRLRDGLAAAARSVLQLPPGELDLPRLHQMLIERDVAIDAALQAAGRADRADRDATNAEEVAAATREQAGIDAREAEAVWAEAESTREALAHALPAWAGRHSPRVAEPILDAWLAGLPTTEEDARQSSLSDAVRRDWYDPAHSEGARAREAADQSLAAAVAAQQRVDEEIAALLDTRVPTFPHAAGWARRDRPEASASGAPLWSLLDPTDGVPDASLARVEAALAAASLLDAWVTPDGVFRSDRDGSELVVVVPPAVDGPNLGDVLRVADCDPALGTTVAGLLAGIALDAAPADSRAAARAALAINTDGRWRSPALSGLAAPQHPAPEWVGESARANRRRRRVEELTAEKADWGQRAQTAQARRDRADTALADLAEALRSCPGDADLRTALARAAERDRVAERSAATAAREESRAGDLRARADDQRAELTRRCTEQSLPPRPDELHQLRSAVHEATSRLRLLEQHLGLRSSVVAALDRTRDRLGRAGEARVEMQGRHERIKGELAETVATVETLEATIDADDREVLDELERLRSAEQQAASAHADLEVELRAIGVRLGSARTQLENTEHEREAATRARDAAWAEFRILLDRGLADEVGLAADPAFAAAERIRDQVAIARRVVSPRGWPAGTAEQAVFVEKLLAELFRLNEETRVRLEASGRSITIATDQSGLPAVSVLVDSTGSPLGPRDASVRLGEIHDELDAAYSLRVQETLDELLGSTFLEHLRERLGATQALISRINHVLADHPVVTTKTSLKIVMEPASPSDATMLEAVSGSSLANPEVAGRVRDRLRERVEEAKRLAEREGEQDWRLRLAQQLDYRDWFEVQLKKRVGSDGRWAPLTTQGFAEMSGGARAVILMLPLVATLAALYEDSDGCPRPLWLDEAFDGLDSANREMVMDLFRSFDLDVLLAGPARLVNVRSVPAAAIYQVVRAPAPLPGVDLTLELWAGGELTEVQLPATLPSGPDVRPEDTLL